MTKLNHHTGIDPVLKLIIGDNKRSKLQPEPKPTGYIKGAISRELSINNGMIIRGSIVYDSYHTLTNVLQPFTKYLRLTLVFM